MEPNQAWIEELAELRAAGRPCVVVVVTGVQGSAPREPGARMIVTEEGLSWGTIGGGNLELGAVERACALLQEEAPRSETQDVILGEDAGQCCGGRVSLFYETFAWRRHTIAVFGAGHVGQALGGLAPWLKARVILIDARDERELVPAPPASSGRPYELVCVDAPAGEIDTLPADALVIVMTHSHPLDLEVLAAALRRGTFPFVGLIGSERKWSRFKKRLAAEGFDGVRIDTIHCPIGVTKGSKDPAAIALSTAAQLVEEMASLNARAAARA